MLINDIKDDYIKLLYIERAKEQGIIVDSSDSYINSGIKWWKTKEGYTYWLNVYSKYFPSK